MPYVTNALDGSRVYYEDDGGPGPPVVMLGGFLDPIELVRRAPLAMGLSAASEALRMVFIDHRGHGRSDTPHDRESYAMPRRAGDVVAVLDELAIARAHIVGLSWGGRLALGIGEHAAERARCIVVVGQQPYAIDPGGPLARIGGDALAGSHDPTILPLVDAFEAIAGRYPDDVRALYLASDAAAMHAAWDAAINAGSLSERLDRWRIPVLFCLADGDIDFLDQARRAAEEIPNAQLVVVAGTDHLGMDTANLDPLVPTVLRTFQRADSPAATG
jgi:pimeloyl-ACP methyl ester carboxylesterase